VDSSLSSLDKAAAAQDNSERMTHTGKAEDGAALLHWLHYTFLSLMGGAKTDTWLEIALVS